MRLHFPSVAVGVAAVSIILLSMSQAGPTVSPPRIEYGPNPRDMVQVREGTPYVVPAGRLFVLTAIGTGTGNGQVNFQVNGLTTEILSASYNGTAPSMLPVASGLTVPANSTITLFGQQSAGAGLAWGYLSPL